MANKIIDSLTYGSDNYTFSIPYGTCSTSATFKNKVVNCPNFTVLEAGARVAVKFIDTNIVESPTLNVNNTGAKTINAMSISNGQGWPSGTIVDFVFDGTDWCVIQDAGLYASLMEGDVEPYCCLNAHEAQGLRTGKTDDVTGDPIPLDAEYLGVLATQNSCFALGAKVANTDSAYPPFLVAKTSSTANVNTYAGTLLTRHPGLRFSTEWYSGDWDGASYATGEYVITNTSPFPITVYFNLSASFEHNGAYQPGSSSRRIKCIDPGETISGEADVSNPWGANGAVYSNYPDVVIEAIGYDTTDLY